MKIRIYIVDDEWMAIKYLNYLLAQTNLDYEVVGQSTNSVQALEEILRTKPDVLFADVDMPEMDGLVLAEKVLERLPLKIFLLTSYRDFDYVKRGIQIGVADYILKNEVDENVLERLLEKTVQEMTTEKKQQHLILEYRVRQFLLSVSKDIEKRTYEHRPAQRYALVSVRAPSGISMKYQARGEPHRADCREIQNLPYPAGVECSSCTETGIGEICGVFFLQESVTDSQRILEEACGVLIRYFKKQKRKCQCMVSDTLQHFFDLQGGYQEICILWDYTYAYPGRNIFFASWLRGKSQSRKQPDEWMDGFVERMERQDAAGTERYTKELFIRWRQRLSVWEYTENFQSIYMYLRSFIQKKHLQNAILDIPGWYADANSAEQTLMECLRMIFEELRQVDMDKYSLYVRQAIACIRENYGRDISVPDIAREVKVSEGHLRRLFRQELNMTLVDYLTEYRLECAKLMMKNGRDSLGEIWKRCGFTSAQYFSYVFKKNEGMLPKDYMKKVRNGQRHDEE